MAHGRCGWDLVIGAQWRAGPWSVVASQGGVSGPGLLYPHRVTFCRVFVPPASVQPRVCLPLLPARRCLPPARVETRSLPDAPSAIEPHSARCLVPSLCGSLLRSATPISSAGASQPSAGRPASSVARGTNPPAISGWASRQHTACRASGPALPSQGHSLLRRRSQRPADCPSRFGRACQASCCRWGRTFCVGFCGVSVCSQQG